MKDVVWSSRFARRDERGEAKPLLKLVLSVAIFGFLLLRVLGGFETGKEFEQRIHARLRVDPAVADADFLRAVATEAAVLGVLLGDHGVWTERRGPDGAISRVHLTYDVRVSLGVFEWRKQAIDRWLAP